MREEQEGQLVGWGGGERGEVGQLVVGDRQEV